MLNGAKCDESLLRVRVAGSSPAFSELLLIQKSDGPLSREDLSQRATSLGMVCHRHRGGGHHVTRLLDLGLASSEIKPYVHRTSALDAGNASIHGVCRLTAAETCTQLSTVHNAAYGELSICSVIRRSPEQLEDCNRCEAASRIQRL